PIDSELGGTEPRAEENARRSRSRLEGRKRNLLFARGRRLSASVRAAARRLRHRRRAPPEPRKRETQVDDARKASLHSGAHHTKETSGPTRRAARPPRARLLARTGLVGLFELGVNHVALGAGPVCGRCTGPASVRRSTSRVELGGELVSLLLKAS